MLHCEKTHSAESIPFNQPFRANRRGKTLQWRFFCRPYNAPNGPATQLSPIHRFQDYDHELHASSTQQYQTVTGYDESGVEVNAERYNYSLIVMPEMAPRAWPVASFEALTEEHFQQILADAPDVVILGTGARQRFVHPKLTMPLTSRRIGVDCMDTQAACRTYNILMGEGRKVTLALIIPPFNPDDAAKSN